MGAAATVSKEEDDLMSRQKTASSSKSQDRNRTTVSMVVCSSCKTQLGIFKRKASLLMFVTSKELQSDVKMLISDSISNKVNESLFKAVKTYDRYMKEVVVGLMVV